MLKFLEDSEAAKVSTRDLKERASFPNESNVNTVRSAKQARNEKNNKTIRDLQTWRERGRLHKCGEVSGTIQRLRSAGETLLGAQVGSGTFERKTRSYGRSDGEQERHAEDSSGKCQEKIFEEFKEMEEQRAK